jgi:hypothetical protein
MYLTSQLNTSEVLIFGLGVLVYFAGSSDSVPWDWVPTCLSGTWNAKTASRTSRTRRLIPPTPQIISYPLNLNFQPVEMSSNVRSAVTRPFISGPICDTEVDAQPPGQAQLPL